MEKEKRIDHSFRVNSNGYDIDAYACMLQKHSSLFSFQITVDGVEEIQNQRKPHFKNSDSFMKITNNIDFLLKCGIPVNVRINSDLYTINKIHNLLSFLKIKGGINIKISELIVPFYVRRLMLNNKFNIIKWGSWIY